jgi:zinc/manganese transport system substrate-binding protein
MKKRLLAFAALCSLTLGAYAQTPASGAHTAPAPVVLQIVAAENFYGDVIKQLGGTHVKVTSILSNPDQDPHLFEADPRTARALAHAQLVVYSGADYDPWMTKLLQASPVKERQVVVVADLVERKAGDNPHIWYAPQTMPALASKLHSFLRAADPANRAEYDLRFSAFSDSLRPLDAKVAELHTKYAGRPATATEPVFGYMAEAIGLQMRNDRFQVAVMNDTEPSAADMAAFEGDLKHRKVQVLLYNAQASSALTRRMLALAKASRIAAVKVTETEPLGMTYQTWMLSQLNALDTALASYAP